MLDIRLMVIRLASRYSMYVSKAIILCIILSISSASAFSVKELLGIDQANTDQPIKKEGSPTPTKPVSPLTQQLDFDYISKVLANMNTQEREQVLSDKKTFTQLIENQLNNSAVLDAALANKIEQNKNVQFLIQYNAKNMLRDIYLEQLIKDKVPADFPTEEQISEYYKNNTQKFVLPERVHVWQIYFDTSKLADADAIAKVKVRANTMSTTLKGGKGNFADLALAHSEHDPSKVAGGYMGLLNTADLLPQIRTTILSLKVGQISKPIESASGIHILRRGELLKEETIALPNVTERIKTLLLQQTIAQLKSAIFTEARKQYGQDIPDKKITEWYLQLQTDTTSEN